MPTHIDWSEISLRLALTVAAGFLIGLNRGEHGHAAGMRTTILVCLAAAVSMIQVNVLLGSGGRKPDSFMMLDLMRLPLGILSGMGFIGAGAILRRGNVVSGVTTAATLWFVTVIGLCFGGGQLGLGAVSMILTLIVLWGLKWLELRLKQEQLGTLILRTDSAGPTEKEVREKLLAAGFAIVGSTVGYVDHSRQRKLSCALRWRARPIDSEAPGVICELAEHPGVDAVEWIPNIAEGYVHGSPRPE